MVNILIADDNVDYAISLMNYINKQNTNSKINNNNLQLVNVVSKKITNTDELTKMSIEK